MALAQPPAQWVVELFPRVKRQECEADHSAVSRADVNPLKTAGYVMHQQV